MGPAALCFLQQEGTDSCHICGKQNSSSLKEYFRGTTLCPRTLIRFEVLQSFTRTQAPVNRTVDSLSTNRLTYIPVAPTFSAKSCWLTTETDTKRLLLKFSFFKIYSIIKHIKHCCQIRRGLIRTFLAADH